MYLAIKTHSDSDAAAVAVAKLKGGEAGLNFFDFFLM